MTTEDVKMEVEEKDEAKPNGEDQEKQQSDSVNPGEAEPKTEESNSDKEDQQTNLGKKKPKSDLTAGAAATANPHFRVKISGLPRFYTPTDPLLVDFKNLLYEQLGLNYKYIRSPKKGNSWLYITFYSQKHQEKALKLLKHYKWKGRTLICTLVVADVLKRKQEDCGQDTPKRPRLDISIEEQMLMSTIPYHSVSYQEQLSKKNEEAECLFKWLAVCMEKKRPQLIGYIDQEVAKNPKTKLPFKLDEVRASPVIDGYRNKCEFRIGLDPQTKKVIIGYRVDNQEGDNIAVAAPDSLRHLPKEMIDVVKVFEKFVQESAYPPQIQNHDTGVWRLLHLRINKAKQLMVVALINPTVLTEEQLGQLKQDLVKYVSEGPAKEHNIVSLYLHTDNDVKSLSQADKMKRIQPQGQLELLWGQSYIEEQLLDLKLEIDPNFYFQNNTWGAEELYKAVMELAGVDEETTVLDLCCGSGGMGMMFAKKCKEVIGVEVMDINVDDAKRLAAKNGLTNCEFLQGSVDDLFPELEEKLKGKKVVPILDPPRVGISSKLILSLRKMKEAERIVYVCSNHKLPSKNIMDMSLLEGENKEFVGTKPFFPTRVIPVDLSPHSLRCELVILLERLDMDKIPKPKRFPPPTTAKCFYYAYDHHPKAGNKNKKLTQRTRGGLLPPPLRGNPYRNRRGGFDPTAARRPWRARAGIIMGRGRPTPPVPFRPIPPPHPQLAPPPPRREFDDGFHRYSGFRRDVEDVIDSYPSRGQVSQRLAMANAMLEQGLRLASEAMAEDYNRPVRAPLLPAAPYAREGRVPYAMRDVGMDPGPWGRNSGPVPWRSSWEEGDYEMSRPVSNRSQIRENLGVIGGRLGGGVRPTRGAQVNARAFGIKGGRGGRGLRGSRKF